MILTPITSPLKAIAADMLGLSAAWADDQSCTGILEAAGIDAGTDEQVAAFILTTLAVATYDPPIPDAA